MNILEDGIWLFEEPKYIRTISPETERLARRAVMAKEAEECAMSQMTPEQKEQHIKDWAWRLAQDVCELSD